jgi:tRNA-dependent cyclodipeptide synthase
MTFPYRSPAAQASDKLDHMATDRRYSVTLRETIPPRAKILAGSARAYAGVSAGNPNFNGPRLRSFLEWIEHHVADCRLVLGRELARWTVMIERGLSEEQARSVAASQAQRQASELRRSLSRVSRPDVFTLVEDTDLRAHPRFNTALHELQELFIINDRFADLVNLSARLYCETRLQRGRPLQVEFGQAVEYSRRFILEELALFCVLVTTGSPIEIYPGPELPVLNAVANGTVLGAPAELMMRTNLVVDIAPISAEEAA